MDDGPSKIDPELLARVNAGAEDAGDRLVELLYPLIHSIIRSHVHHRADHQDLAQEVYMKIFLKLDQYRGPRPFEHWVSRITVRTCYDWLRKQRARPLLSYADLNPQESELLEGRLSGNLAGDVETQHDLFTGLLDKLLTSLTPKEQIVIRLLDLEERSVKEASEITGWGASKIKTIAMRTRRKLADQLRRLEGESGS